MPLLLAVSVTLLTPQVCTAVVTGTAGCAGTILRRELTPLKTAPIILWTLTPQVSSESQELTSHDLVFFLKKLAHEILITLRMNYSPRLMEPEYNEECGLEDKIHWKYVLLHCVLQKRPQSTVGRMVSGFATQTPTGLGPTTHSAMKTPQPNWR